MDFKSAESLGISDMKKKEISKDVSAFANSDGGIIIYGLREENHKAHSFSYINGSTITKEWLEQIINSNISRRINNIEIFPIREDNDLSKTIYLVKILRSPLAPHQANDGRFYKRFNFLSAQMEEYEIRDVYNRKSNSKLQIANISYRFLEKESSDSDLHFSMLVDVINDGAFPEKNYKINLYFQEAVDVIFTWNKRVDNYESLFAGKEIKISSMGKSTIYRDETVCVMALEIIIPEKIDLNELKKIKSRALLLYSNGEDETEVNINELVKFVSFLRSR